MALPPQCVDAGGWAGRYGHPWGVLVQADLGGAAGSVQITAGRRVIAFLLVGGVFALTLCEAQWDSGTRSASTRFLKGSGK